MCYTLRNGIESTGRSTILKRFRAAVTEIYGDRVARVVLFGSRARGDAEPDSDYDVAVFLRDLPDRFAEMNGLPMSLPKFFTAKASSFTRCLIGRMPTTKPRR